MPTSRSIKIIILATALAFLANISIASAAKSPSAQSLGFQQYYKCASEDDVIHLGDTATAAACLYECRKQDEAAGCWWIDGTGGVQRECRACRTLVPETGSVSNDWAMPLNNLNSSNNNRALHFNLIPPRNLPNPASSGFERFAKCHGKAKGLGDTVTPAACLTACRNQSDAKGCWWLDGTAGFPRECRICVDGPPSRDVFSNDWGIAVNR